ncbi:MAG: GerMN domain-containing protein [Defluviitaleaceae bacterium]|nr:GerMN domain-containing protein [Defluviitaleaceae bacterium]
MSKNSRKNKKNSRSPLLPILALAAAAIFAVLIIFDPFSNDDYNGVDGDNENGQQIDQNGDMELEYIDIIFRFPDAEGMLQEELRQMELRADNDMVRAIIYALQNGPQDPELNNVMPAGLLVENFHVIPDSNELRVVFSSEFDELTHAQRIILTASMVYTLTELDFVEYLEFFVGQHPVLDGNGIPFGLRSRANTILDTDIDVPTTTIVLYFMDEQSMGLIAEPRTIATDAFTSDAEAIVAALLQGPQRSDLFAVIPSYVTVLDVNVMSDLASVNFAPDFLNIFAGGGTLMERMVVYSLVNSLTERPEINRVQILIGGFPLLPDDTDVSLHTDFSRPFERNESVIRGE